MRPALLFLPLTLAACDAFGGGGEDVRLRVGGATVRGETASATYDERYGIGLRRGSQTDLHGISFFSAEALRPGVYDVQSPAPGLDKGARATISATYTRFTTPRVGLSDYEVPEGQLTLTRLKDGGAEGRFTFRARDRQTRRTFEVAGTFRASPSPLRLQE